MDFDVIIVLKKLLKTPKYSIFHVCVSSKKPYFLQTDCLLGPKMTDT